MYTARYTSCLEVHRVLHFSVLTRVPRLVMVLIAIGFATELSLCGTKTVTVPNVVGQAPASAEAALSSAGLHGVKDLGGGCPSNVGNRPPSVNEQQPSAGTQVDPGSTVHLHIC